MDLAPTLLEAAAAAAPAVSNANSNANAVADSGVRPTSSSETPPASSSSTSTSESSSLSSAPVATGVSVWGALVGGGPSPRSSLLLQYDQVLRCGALRRGRFKVVWNGDCGAPPALFGGWEATVGVPGGGDGGGGGSDGGSKGKGNGGVDPAAQGAWFLFDVDADPSERRPLASAPDLPRAPPEDGGGGGGGGEEGGGGGSVYEGVLASMRQELEATGPPLTGPALAWEVPGDPRASPALHGGS